MRAKLFHPLSVAFIITLLSWLTVEAGTRSRFAKPQLDYGSDMIDPNVSKGRDLFRFDAEYYFKIATEGYAYNGDPASSPNIVFAPLFPVLISLAAAISGADELDAGFAINKLMFLLSIFFLYLYLKTLLSEWRAAMVLSAMATTAGAYSFHAYYSETTMLFCISLCLYALQRKYRPLLAAAAAALGASRLTGLPMAGAVAVCFLMGYRRTKSWQCLIYAMICPLGAAAYLGYIWLQFGNPFTMFPEIQKSSWAFFHPETSYFYIFSGKNLWDYAVAAMFRESNPLTDIKTLNLVWTLLAMASIVWSWRKFGAGLFNYMFTGYFLFIYATGAGSDFLISAHRFYALMLPIFLMFNGLTEYLQLRYGRIVAHTVAGLLFCVNLYYCLMHTSFFNRGIWFYF